MSKRARQLEHDELRSEYDFAGGVRGKHAKRYADGTNVVLLAPDVAKVFRNADDVNTALRALIEIASKTVPINRD